MIKLVVLDTLFQSRQALMISCLTTEQPQLLVYTIQASKDIDCLSPHGTEARTAHFSLGTGQTNIRNNELNTRYVKKDAP